MLVVDLHCENGHLFEGWFASGDDLSAQQERGLLSCPVCASLKVVRRPSAARLNVASLKAAKLQGTVPDQQLPRQEVTAEAKPSAEPGASPEAEAALALQAMYLQAVRHVLDHTEDVGQRFVEEVRGMHHGDVPERAIRGDATPEQRAALQDEGIEVLAMAVPGFMKPKGSLQ